MIRPFLVAVQFLTRLPVPLRRPPSEADIGRSVLWYPLIGLLIGALLAALQWVLQPVDAPLTAALLLTVWVVCTGALHLDGLADSADAWAGGLGDREKTLAIMKDPRCGPVGVVALVLLLLLKFAALLHLASSPPLLLAPLLARTALPLLILTTPYVRAGGLGSALAKHLPRGAAAAVVGLTTALALLASPSAALGALACTALLFAALRALMLARIGGWTGDTAGALVETLETGILLVTSLLS